MATAESAHNAKDDTTRVVHALGQYGTVAGTAAPSVSASALFPCSHSKGCVVAGKTNGNIRVEHLEP